MNWCWAPHVYAAMCGQDLVLLDVRENAYMVIADAQGVVELGDGARARVDAEDLRAQFVEAGLGGASGDPSPLRARSPLAAMDLESGRSIRATGAEMIALAGAFVSLVWCFRLRRFDRVIAGRASDPEEISPAARERIIRRALVFRRLLPWAPFQGQCLYRAALLRRFLGRDRDQVRWVFGVATWPFAAHCWLQLDELVLNDRCENVGRYTPIMAV